jgi:rRNA maturation endonuclease Nob1
MGSAAGYVCAQCGHRADFVVDNYSFGFSGDVMVAAVCSEHNIVSARTGENVATGAIADHPQHNFMCPECGTICLVWDRKTCPSCGGQRMEPRSHIEFD